MIFSRSQKVEVMTHHDSLLVIDAANQTRVYILIKRNEFEKLKELATNGSDQVRYEISFFLNFFTFEKVVK